MLQIAVAMNYLHESGVMHCDLKATNVLVNVLEDDDAYLVICASNFETFVSEKLSCMTLGTTMPLVGTTWWSAPEAFEDEENRDKDKSSRCV
jgi:serine/threonine protein kinase